MGDKGGKKDKEKNKQQQAKKQLQEQQRRQDKARPRDPNRNDWSRRRQTEKLDVLAVGNHPWPDVELQVFRIEQFVLLQRHKVAIRNSRFSRRDMLFWKGLDEHDRTRRFPARPISGRVDEPARAPPQSAHGGAGDRNARRTTSAETASVLILEDVETLTAEDQAELLARLDGARSQLQIISTTEHSLFPLVARGLFDAALYYRLNVVLLRFRERDRHAMQRGQPHRSAPISTPPPL
jgi:Sigma-54 interaction domain